MNNCFIAGTLAFVIMLFPHQFAPLNGNQSGTDGLNFDGTRPTTVSATGPGDTTSVINFAIDALDAGSQTNIDVLGTITPIGAGRSDIPGASYISSLIVADKRSIPVITR